MSNELSVAIDGLEWRALMRARDSAAADPGVDADAEVITRCRAGDQAAFQTLVRRYQRKAFWIAYEMVNDREEALDIVQEAFVRVYRSIDRFDRSRKFYTWLYRIVSNLCIDSLRKSPKQKAISIDSLGDTIPRGGSPRESLEKRELGMQIEQILSVLPHKYKTMIVLRDVEGLSCKEIAKIVNCSHANVRWRLHKARKLFKELWERKFAFKGVPAT